MISTSRKRLKKNEFEVFKNRLIVKPKFDEKQNYEIEIRNSVFSFGLFADTIKFQFSTKTVGKQPIVIKTHPQNESLVDF